MGETRKTVAGVSMLLTLLVAGCGLWWMHAEAWSLGRRSPVLSYDTAQYALAARELAQTGRMQTPYALPIELASHPQPPWPLALVQPGLVILEPSRSSSHPRSSSSSGEASPSGAGPTRWNGW